MHYQIHKIGLNRGVPRVWLEGMRLTNAGFMPACRYVLERDESGLILRATPTGHRAVVRGKKGEREFPIIDLNSAELLKIFDGLENVKVTYEQGLIRLEPVASEKRMKDRIERFQQKMQTGTPLSVGSLAHGIGVMDDALRNGLQAGDIPTKLHFYNELRDELVEHVLTLRPDDDAIALTGSMSEFGFDRAVMERLGHVDILSAGLSCKGASVAGRAKNKLTHPEDHPEAGHLVLSFISILSYTNPLLILLENVESYQNTASMSLIRAQLNEFGYDLHEAVLNGRDFDAFEPRKRFVMVAVTRGMKFDFASIQYPIIRHDKKLSEIMDNVPADDPCWSEMTGLKEKEMRDIAAGKGFAMQIFNGTESEIKTLTAGLARNRSTDPKFSHPTNPKLLRIPTVSEHARAKGISLEMIKGVTSKTLGHEMLGQSVIYQKFVAVGRAIAAMLRSSICNPAQQSADDFQLTSY